MRMMKQKINMKDPEIRCDIDPVTKHLMLGDIVICEDVAKANAEEYGHSFEREICYLVVHGFLHLLGYDHMNEEDEKTMFKLQEDILDGYGIKR